MGQSLLRPNHDVFNTPRRFARLHNQEFHCLTDRYSIDLTFFGICRLFFGLWALYEFQNCLQKPDVRQFLLFSLTRYN